MPTYHVLYPMAKLLWPAVQSPSYTDLPQYAQGDAAVYDITQDEVYMHLRMIKLHSVAGSDGITSWILFTFADVISLSLAYLYNLSIYTGQRPTDWKLSNVVPIPTEPNRLGSISLLPIVSEVLERHLHQF